MTHEFSTDPVKIRLIDIRTGEWKKSYVFVGTVPSGVEKELHKIERNIKYNSPALKKFYGSAWRTRLGIQGTSVTSNKQGGDDALPPADVEQKDLDQEDLFGKDIMEELGNLDVDKIIEESKDTSSPDEKSERAADDLDVVPEEKIIDKKLDVDFLAKKVETLSIVKSEGIEFIFDTLIYPIDNVLQLKYKLYLAIGIPAYRQHLWFKYKNRSYPMSYALNIHKHIENVDIERLIEFYKQLDAVPKESKESKVPKESKAPKKSKVSKAPKKSKKDMEINDIEGIPIEIEYYKNKEFMQVISYDSFTLLLNLYEKYATNEFFLVDINSLIKPADLYGKLHTDKYQMELIYYGFVMLYFPMITFTVFNDYLKNEKLIGQIYPELTPSKNLLSNKFDLEAKITNEAYEAQHDKSIVKKLYSSVTQTIVSIDNFNQDVELLISLRNLFDALELNDNITYCKANILHGTQNVVLRKSYFNEKEPKDIIPLNSVLIKIKINVDTNENMRLVIFKNGNYNVYTNWREENHMDFPKIIRVVSEKINPVIKMINKFGDRIKFYNIPLMELNKHNAIFTETALAFYYDDDVTESRFNMLKTILDDYRQSDIITPKENISLGYEFFFNKGMYKYDVERIEKSISLDNYYDFLSSGIVSQKWETVFGKTRLFQILNVSSKLKITISGIRDDLEMFIFHMYLMGLLKIYSINAAKIKIVGEETLQAKSKKALKNLKVQDPILYDFKKIYKSNVVYSKICQKPYQPLILSDEEVRKLSSSRKANAVKYWNFTKQKPVWYSCPNPKYPYIKFITKQHPKDFCIPCCKKIAMNENVNQKKQDIHSTCMKSHMYTGEKIILTKGSHYIASYGKDIEVGRLSRLPENTLEPLFFDTYSPNGGIDQECATADGYYLYGVDQNTLAINNIGYLFCLVNSLNMPVDAFLSDCIARIKKGPDKFRVLLDGNIGMYFTDVKELTDIIFKINSDDYMIDTKYENVPWNMLFMSLSYYYYGINTLFFDDTNKENIEMVLPRGLKNPNDMFPETHKNLVILRHRHKYYPIYLFNTEIFKRTGIIETRLFVNESGLVTIIRAVVRKTFDSDISSKIKENIDLATMKHFVNSTDGVSITHYYVNYSNLCYGVVLKYKQNQVYIPVTASHYSLEKDIKLIFEPYRGNFDVDFTIMRQILSLLLKWNMDQSKKAKLEGILMYPKIMVEQWFRIKGDSKITGFICNNMNYYIKPIDESTAISHINCPVQTLLYYPYVINALIYSVKSGKQKLLEEHNQKLEISLYNHYLYHLVLLHFITIFNSQRNMPLRKKLTLLLTKTDFSKDLENVRTFIKEISDQDDIAKIKHIISRYVTVHHDKKQMLFDIRAAYFNFDRIILEKFKELTPKQINIQLHKLAQKFVKVGSIKAKSFKFPNIFVSCQSKQKTDYCAGNKIIIEKDKLNEILDILSHDIANPSKWKWLFNPVFIDKSVNFLKFIRRKNETITIEFVE